MNKIGSSETIRKTTLCFTEYKKNLVSHKKSINKSFLEWFIGFAEGDGSFLVSNDDTTESGVRLFFIINQKEEKVLYYIRSNLGFGKVSTYTSYSRYIVADRKSIDRLIYLFNGNLLLDKTNARFALWLDARNKYSLDEMVYKPKNCPTPNILNISKIPKHPEKVSGNFLFPKHRFAMYGKSKKCQGCQVTSPITSPSNTTKGDVINKSKNCFYPADQQHRFAMYSQSVMLASHESLSDFFDGNAWLSGFIDAEGCFNAQHTVDKRYTLGFRVRLRFILDQKYEYSILKKICVFLQSGLISTRKLPPTEKGRDLCGMYRYTSTHMKSHQKLIEYLNRYPLHTKKKVAFYRWTTLLYYMKNRKNLPWQGKVLYRVKNIIKNLHT